MSHESVCFGCGVPTASPCCFVVFCLCVRGRASREKITENRVLTSHFLQIRHLLWRPGCSSDHRWYGLAELCVAERDFGRRWWVVFIRFCGGATTSIRYCLESVISFPCLLYLVFGFMLEWIVRVQFFGLLIDVGLFCNKIPSSRFITSPHAPNKQHVFSISSS